MKKPKKHVCEWEPKYTTTIRATEFFLIELVSGFGCKCGSWMCPSVFITHVNELERNKQKAKK